jgi:hypothetical protein
VPQCGLPFVVGGWRDDRDDGEGARGKGRRNAPPLHDHDGLFLFSPAPLPAPRRRLALRHGGGHAGAGGLAVAGGDAGVLAVGGVRAGLLRAGPQAAVPPLPRHLVPRHGAADRRLGRQPRRAGHVGGAVSLAHRPRRAPRPRRPLERHGRRVPLVLQRHRSARELLRRHRRHRQPQGARRRRRRAVGQLRAPGGHHAARDENRRADAREGPRGADALHVLGERHGSLAGPLRARTRPGRLWTGLHLGERYC